MRLRTFLVAIVCSGSSVAAAGAELPPMELTLEPADAEIGIFHDDVELVVTAKVESGVEVALLVTGPPLDLNLSKKERVWGLFWAPVEDVAFENVPSLYLLRTSTELENLAPRPILDEMGLGYEALRSSLENGGEEALFQELIRLKESEGLFSFSADANEMSNPPGTERTSVRVQLPANAPAATYSIQLFGFRGGKLVARGEDNFDLTQTKLIAFITSLAHEHGLFYGILAVVVALGAGLCVGFLYGTSAKH